MVDAMSWNSLQYSQIWPFKTYPNFCDTLIFVQILSEHFLLIAYYPNNSKLFSGFMHFQYQDFIPLALF